LTSAVSPTGVPSGTGIHPGTVMARVRRQYPAVAAFAVLLALWEVLPLAGVVNSSVMPPAFEVLGNIPSLLSADGFGAALTATVENWIVGVAAAIVVGTLLGTLMGRSAIAFYALNRIITLGYSTPKVALVVPLIVLVGSGALPIIIVVFLGALIPVVTSAFHGSRQIKREHVWAARSAGVSRWAVPFRVVLPSALPQLLAGYRLAIALGLLDVMGAQFIVRSTGIGAFLYDSFDVGQFTQVWSAATVVAALGLIADLLYVGLTRRSFRWLA